MSQQWIWMSLAAGTMALGAACDATESPVLVAQVDPNSAGAVTSGQPNPGAPAGSVPGTMPGTGQGLPSTQSFGDPGGGMDAGTGGSGSGAVLPQPYTAPPSVTGTAQNSVTSSGAVVPLTPGSMAAPGAGATVSSSGAVLPPTPGSMAAPGTGATVSGSGEMLPPAPGSTIEAPGAGATVSGSGVLLPPSTGTTASGAAGTTLSPDSNTSSNSVTPPGGGSVIDEGVRR